METAAMEALAQAASRSHEHVASSRRQMSLVAVAAIRPTPSAGAKKLAMCQKASTGCRDAAFRAAIL